MMSLPISDLPRQLEAEVDEWVWPGDDAVDIAASDLDQWVRHGGDTGLVMRPGSSPTRIKIGPLSDRAFRRVLTAMQRSNDSTYLDEAFRYGVRSFRGGGARIGLIRIDGLPALDDRTLDALGGCEAEIPWVPLHLDLLRSMEAEIPEGYDAATRSATTLPVALGMIVMARTFRSRRGRP